MLAHNNSEIYGTAQLIPDYYVPTFRIARTGTQQVCGSRIKNYVKDQGRSNYLLISTIHYLTFMY